ncbi:hypothetical protein PIB30_102575, partial [Stylosanthes scabra]|nr:hypothetical protein [Stylosanthes scabra]
VILLDPVHLPESLLCLRKRKRKVFERSSNHFGITGLKGPNCINYATLHQMGRGLAQEQPQQAPQDQAGQSEQEHQAGPSEQPSMRDMMQVLLRIEQHQANMHTHLTRVDQRLSRIEQHLEIDEDEDQD